MNEELVRSLVRETIARQLGGASDAGPLPSPMSFVRHGSHYRYGLPKAGDACLIEPNVRCNDCGYCESHGH